ncbi:MAG: ABC transporter permease [Cyclobacteriaceae bacterium]|nr:ABC transporter permease [Cyclobacteriaceae bacterium]
MESQREYFLEIKPKNSFGLNLDELIEHRELFYFFTWRDIKVKYKQTMLGFLWAVLQPLLLTALFTLLLGRNLNIPSEGIDYPVFAFSGLMLWLIFSSGITNAGQSMITQAAVIRKIYFPRLIIPLSSILVSLFDFLMSLVVFIPLLIYYQPEVELMRALWCWPSGVLLTILATLGPGCLLAALNVKFRDFRYVIPFLVQVLLFVTPVIYPVSMIGQRWIQEIMALNPMYAAVAVFRLPFAATEPDATLLIISLVSNVIFLVAGIAYFRKVESFFADLA